VRIFVGFIRISHLIINLSTRSKRYNCIHFPHRLTRIAQEEKEVWSLWFTSGWLRKYPTS